MITDEQVQEILKSLHYLGGRFDNLEARFDNLEARFDVLENRFNGLEIHFIDLETKFEDLTVLAVQTQHQMSNLLTRDEFNLFKSENATAHDRTAKRLDALEQEVRKAESQLAAAQIAAESIKAPTRERVPLRQGTPTQGTARTQGNEKKLPSWGSVFHLSR